MLQKLQTSPRDRVTEVQWSRVLDDTGDRRGQIFGFSTRRFQYLVAAAVGLLILVLVTHPEGGGIIALVVAAVVILPYAIRYVSNHVSGLLIVIVLIEAVAASYFAAKFRREAWRHYSISVGPVVHSPVYSHAVEVGNSAAGRIS